MHKFLLFTCLLLALFHSAVASHYLQRTDVQQFIEQMVQTHRLDKQALQQLFQHAKIDAAVLEKIQSPTEHLAWYDYRARLITPHRVTNGLAFWNENREALSRAAKRYQVPIEIIVAIIGIETSYGKNKGHHRVLDALTTLSFEYPPRAPFFRKELEQLLLLNQHSPNFDLYTLQGSYAGAIGIPQFIPSSYRRFAVDTQAKGYSDLVNSTEDAIASVANYLKQHGWIENGPVAIPIRSKLLSKPGFYSKKQSSEVLPLPKLQAKLLALQGNNRTEYWMTFQNFKVIITYNTSSLYAMAVWQLSQKLQQAYASTQPKTASQ